MSLKASNKVETNRYELEVFVDGEAFSKAINSVYKKQVKNINIPGFRKGKVPKPVVEKFYGKEVFYEDAMKALYPEALQSAADEAGLRLVNDRMDLDVTQAGDDGFTFKVVVTVYPEVSIDGYKGIEIEPVSAEVTDEKINEEIDKARSKAGSIATVEDRPAQNGDIAVIDFEGFLNGEPFDGGEAENYSLTLGSDSFIPGFEEQIVGHSTNDEFTINVTFPDDYQVDELAGQPAEFKITLHEIKERILPELDDEFVMDVSEEASTVEEYKKEIAAELEETLKKERENDIENKIVDILTEKLEGEIPEAMYNNKVTDIMKEFDMRLHSQGLDLETYMAYLGIDEDSFREQNREEAVKRVKIRLALEKIAELESIAADDESLEAEYNKLADMYNMDLDRVKSLIPASELSKDVTVEKAMDFVKENAVIK